MILLMNSKAVMRNYLTQEFDNKQKNVAIKENL